MTVGWAKKFQMLQPKCDPQKLKLIHLTVPKFKISLLWEKLLRA
jgi:hypothetical protein